ncbi:MAG TPA: type II secretion system protein, partial [Leptospiraceae bacterium]|nr:type II secretion system protein [Leptospiraceae bacterium]
MRSRRGMTLVEMGLAIAVAASMMMIVMMTVGSALRMQTESDRLAVAVSLAQTKLSQLMSNP